MMNKIKKYFSLLMNEKEEHDYPIYGTVIWKGIVITIENKKNSYRRGTDVDGNKWEQKMNCDYGRIEYTTGKDKDCLDVFLNDDIDSSENIYIIYQKDVKTGFFDELKFMIGFSSYKEAKGMYFSNYDRTDQYMGISKCSVEDFIKMVQENKIQSLYMHSKNRKLDIDLRKGSKYKFMNYEITESYSYEIFEGLIRSWNDFQLHNWLKMWSLFADKYIIRYIVNKQKYNEENKITPIEIVINSVEQQLLNNDEINKIIKRFDSFLAMIENNAGWYIEQYMFRNKPFKFNKEDLLDIIRKSEYKKNYISIILKPKYDIEVEAPDILYHVSPKLYKNKILQKGLIPKSFNKLVKYPERIYFTDTEDSAIKLIDQLYVHANKELEDKVDKELLNTYVLYKITTKNLLDLKNTFRIFRSLNYVHEYYTVCNIPPRAITVIDEIKVNQ